MSLQIPLALRLRILQRDGYRCVRCAADLHGQRYSVHHRKPRGSGGSTDPRINDPRNLVSLCGSGTTACHGWVHNHPREAVETGWTLRSLDLLDAAVVTRYGARVTLLEDGGVRIDRRRRP